MGNVQQVLPRTKCPVFRLRHFVLTTDGLIPFLNVFSGNYKLKMKRRSNATEQGSSALAIGVARADVHQPIEPVQRSTPE